MKAKLSLLLLVTFLLNGCCYLSNESTPLGQKAEYARRGGWKGGGEKKGGH